MSQAKNKTQKTKASVMKYINAIESPERKKDIKIIYKLLKEITGEKPEMWGTAIVGYGTYHYKYESGREGDFMKSGFSSRKTAITLYIMAGMQRFPKLMAKLGKYKTGKSCLYIKKLDDINLDILSELLKKSHDYMSTKYG
ncbi:MAG: DUF1801 domain-containing protein [Saprospiraceae bacterium]|nr:DUF1801 domain-containing protein [Bacteroidia bacterium]NNE13540.1 DUF1801 domain-containing protein [Saprospiraceae bacterium]NNL93084.1 DUF1801 domain-containing protein [Saprospiraceae bacterium]